MPLPRTHAKYLADRLTCVRGFRCAKVPEAQVLADDCDVCLERLDAFGFTFVGIVDATGDVSRRWATEKVVLKDVLARCNRYAGNSPVGFVLVATRAHVTESRTSGSVFEYVL